MAVNKKSLKQYHQVTSWVVLLCIELTRAFDLITVEGMVLVCRQTVTGKLCSTKRQVCSYALGVLV
jgi:hypothetical protein